MANDKKIPTLEEIALSAGKFNMSSQLSERNSYASELSNWYAYQESIGGNPSELNAMYNYGQDPEILSIHMAEAAKIDREKTIKYVSEGLDNIVEKLGEGEISALSVNIGLKDKKYESITKALKSENQGEIIKSVRDDYLERNKDNEYLIAWAKTSRPSAWMSYANIEVNRIQQNFLEKNLYSEVEEEDKNGKKQKALKYDSKKATVFLKKTISELKDKEKENAYLTLGNIALGIHQKELEKKEKRDK